MKYISYLYLMISMALMSVAAVANDEQHVLASCQALKADLKGDSIQPCRYYLQGFLAGAIAANRVNTAERSEQKNKFSAFMKRAYRTRVGDRNQRDLAAQSMHFCIPKDESGQGLIEKLSKQLTLPIETTQALENTVYKALITKYPCA